MHTATVNATATWADHAAAGLALVAALGVSAAGCESSAERHARDERRMIAALTEARDAVCACRDLACAEDAEARLADFLLQRVDRLKKIPAKASGHLDALALQATQLDGELHACKQRLQEGRPDPQAS